MTAADHDTTTPETSRSPELSHLLQRDPIAWELPLILLLSCVWFFWGTGIGDFSNTEGLRALVAREMYQGQHGYIPTVHHRVYLRKFPLHAWTTAALAHAVGHFDEQVARWPSAGMGVLYVLTIYFAARFFVHKRAGMAGAIIALTCVRVLEYGMKAELDIGVLTMTTLACTLLGYAWLRPGAGRAVGLLGCYVAALIGSYWKAPHVFVAVWFTVLGMLYLDRKAGKSGWWRFAFHPMQIVGSLLNLGAFAAWFYAQSQAVHSSERAGKFVLIEVLARVVPHKVAYLVGLLTAIPDLIVMSLPASLFALVMLRRSSQEVLDERQREGFRALKAWFVPTFIFLMLVEEKAGRHWFLNIGCVTLFGTMGWCLFRQKRLPHAVDHATRWIPIGLHIVLMVLSAFVVLLGGMLLAGVVELNGVSSATGGVAALICGSVAIGIGIGFRPGGLLADRRVLCGAALAVMLLVMKPVQVTVLWPFLTSYDSVLGDTARIEELVPEGTPVFVLSDKPNSDRAGELSDFGYYCRRDIQWPQNVDVAIERAGDGPCYLILRDKARARLAGRFGERLRKVTPLKHRNQQVFLMKLELG